MLQVWLAITLGEVPLQSESNWLYVWLSPCLIYTLNPVIGDPPVLMRAQLTVMLLPETYVTTLVGALGG